jgi:hypothetical protein
MYNRAYESKEGASRIQNGIVSRSPKTLLTLYQRKGLDIARAGAPSPLATSSGRQAGS